jgi:hypothetical protein
LTAGLLVRVSGTRRKSGDVPRSLLSFGVFALEVEEEEESEEAETESLID